MDKTSARQKGLQYRKSLSAVEQITISDQVSKQLTRLLSEIYRSGPILSYAPLASEIHPSIPYPADLLDNSKHTPHPTKQYEIVIMPAVAVDTSGLRVGMGGGWYDRFLATSAAIRIACCYENLVYDTITDEPHDIRVDYICTESRIIKTTVES